MNSFKSYPKYKPTSIDWIGDIPEHWTVKKIKYLFRIKKDIAGKLGFDVLSITQKGIKVKDIKSGEGQLAMDYSKYQLVNKGDFAMNHMDLLTGYVDISKYNGVISPDYRVFILSDKQSNPRYYLYLLQFCYTNRIFFNYGQGSSQLGRWRLAADEFNNFFYPCPSLKEQTQITNFLDHKCRLIDKFLDKKQQLINTLKEQKQAVINQAVTQGLNPGVEMKDSAVELLGKIPANWEVKKLGVIAKVIDPQPDHRAPEVDPNGYPYLGIRDINEDGTINIETARFVNEQAIIKQEKSYEINEDDIVFCKVGTLGFPKHFKIPNTRFALSATLVIIKIKDDMLKFYTKLFLESRALYNQIDLVVTGSTRPALGIQQIRKFKIFIPPLNEMKEVLTYLENEIGTINKAISRIEKEMELTRDYRQILISEAVTGKIDVRNWQRDSETKNDIINIAAEPNGNYSVASK